MEAVTQHRPEGCEGKSQKDVWGKNISGRGNNKSEGLKTGWCLECSRNSKDWGVGGLAEYVGCFNHRHGQVLRNIPVDKLKAPCDLAITMQSFFFQSLMAILLVNITFHHSSKTFCLFLPLCMRICSCITFCTFLLVVKSSSLHTNMDELGGHYALRERQPLYDITYMWNIKNTTNQ